VSHKDTLKLLFPIELGGVFDDDITLDGAQLDNAQISAAQLLCEMFPQSCTDSITDWERVYGLTPASTDTLQTRQLRVIAKMRELGELSLPYFAALATSMGYACTIQELLANTDSLGAEGIFRWRITFTGTPLVYFRAGQSRAGDPLVTGPVASALEGLFTDLKPAHTQVIFAYT
jgi:uncharacterized protein YmfQ (DUF2313 family)